MNLRTLSLISLLGAAVTSNAAIVFSNFNYGPGAVTAGFAVGPTISGNSLRWQPANATVGDLSATRQLQIALTYDARSTSGNIGSVLGTANNAGQAEVGGRGVIAFREDVFELDGAGNEVGGPIGSVMTSTAATGSLPPTTVTLSRQVASIRVKKSFVLAAPASPAYDFATLAQVNQSVQAVPEPATMAVLGLGAAALMRRRKRA